MTHYVIRVYVPGFGNMYRARTGGLQQSPYGPASTYFTQMPAYARIFDCFEEALEHAWGKSDQVIPLIQAILEDHAKAEAEELARSG